MKHVFGRSITHRERFLVDDEVVFPLESAGLVSARIYTDQPTDSQITAKTGHIAGTEVTSWTRKGDQMQIDFPDLTDDTPTSTDDYETRYIVINFLFEAGADEQHVVRPIIVWRANSMISKVRVRATDVWAKEDRIRVLRGPDTYWTDGKVNDALQIVMNKLRAKGYDFKKLADLERLNIACAYLATALCCLDLSHSDNPNWLEKFKIYKGLFDEFFTETPVGYDADGDGLVKPGEQTASSSDQWVTR